MEKFKVGVWSVGVACVIVMCVAAVASVFVQDAGAASQLETLTLLCAGGNLVSLICAAGVKVEEARQAEEQAQIKEINDWYNKKEALHQERRAKLDAAWYASVGSAGRK